MPNNKLKDVYRDLNIELGECKQKFFFDDKAYRLAKQNVYVKSLFQGIKAYHDDKEDLDPDGYEKFFNELIGEGVPREIMVCGTAFHLEVKESVTAESKNHPLQQVSNSYKTNIHSALQFAIIAYLNNIGVVTSNNKPVIDNLDKTKWKKIIEKLLLLGADPHYPTDQFKTLISNIGSEHVINWTSSTAFFLLLSSKRLNDEGLSLLQLFKNNCHTNNKAELFSQILSKILEISGNFHPVLKFLAEHFPSEIQDFFDTNMENIVNHFIQRNDLQGLESLIKNYKLNALWKLAYHCGFDRYRESIENPIFQLIEKCYPESIDKIMTSTVMTDICKFHQFKSIKYLTEKYKIDFFPTLISQLKKSEKYSPPYSLSNSLHYNYSHHYRYSQYERAQYNYSQQYSPDSRAKYNLDDSLFIFMLENYPEQTKKHFIPHDSCLSYLISRTNVSFLLLFCKIYDIDPQTRLLPAIFANQHIWSLSSELERADLALLETYIKNNQLNAFAEVKQDDGKNYLWRSLVSRYNKLLTIDSLMDAIYTQGHETSLDICNHIIEHRKNEVDSYVNQSKEFLAKTLINKGDYKLLKCFAIHCNLDPVPYGFPLNKLHRLELDKFYEKKLQLITQFIDKEYPNKNKRPAVLKKLVIILENKEHKNISQVYADVLNEALLQHSKKAKSDKKLCDIISALAYGLNGPYLLTKFVNNNGVLPEEKQEQKSEAKAEKKPDSQPKVKKSLFSFWKADAYAYQKLAGDEKEAKKGVRQ